MSELLRTQSLFAGALRSAAGESMALGVLSGDAIRNQHLLAVYRGNAVANAGKALELAYPVVQQIVGEEFFSGLCREFWRQHPSRSGDLNEYGEAFPVFLRSFEPVRELPYLVDVAALEWSVSRAAQAEDHAAESLSALSNVAPERMAHLRFFVQPALRLHASTWSIASIWLQHQPDWPGEIAIDPDRAECAAVHRVGLRTQVLQLSSAEMAFWRTAQAGDTLDAMLGEAFALDEQFDVQRSLQRGFAAEFVVALG